MVWRTRLMNCFFGLAILLPTINVGEEGSGNGSGVDAFGELLPKGSIARLGTTRWRVGGHVNALAFSHDDQFLASGSVDDTVRIWEAATGKEIKRFVGHKPWVTSVAYTPDGTKLASAGADKVIRLRDVKSGKEIRSFKGHQGPVACLAFSPNGDILASGGGDKGGDMRLWNANTGDELHRLPHKANQVQSVAFSPNGKTILSGGDDGLVRLWDIATGVERRQFDGKFGNARWIRVAFSSNGRWIAAGGGPREPTIIIWDVENGQVLHRLQGHTHFFMTALTFSPDGKTLASGSRTYEMGNSSVFLWDAATGKEIRRFNHPKHGVSSLAFSHDGKILAGGASNTIHRWQVEDGKVLDVSDAHQEMIFSLVFSPDGKKIVSGAFDGTVRLWEAGTGKHLAKLAEHKSGVPFLAFAADGKNLVHSGIDVRISEVDTGKDVYKLPLGENTHAEALSPDGQTLLTTNSTGTMQLWDIAGAKEIGQLEKTRFRSGIFSPDGKTLALRAEGTIQIWDLTAKKALRTFSVSNGEFDRGIRKAAFSHDGTKLAIVLEVSHTASLWDVATGKEDRRFPEAEHEIFSVAFSANGKFLALGNWDKTIRIYETSSGKQLAHLVGHQGHVDALAFSPDGGTLASASSDTTVLLWSVPADR